MIMWINEFAAQWAEYFGWALIQNSIFLGIIILVLRLMKDAPARILYWVGMAGLIKLIVPPFLTAPFLKPGPIILSSLGLISIQPVINLSDAPPPPPPPALDLASILLLVWIALLLIFLIWPLIATIRMKRQLSGASPVDNWKVDGIRILKTDRINVPMTFGIFKESIYVPTMWNDWTHETRRMIMAHEIAHIHRKDGLGRIFQILIQAIYFFHPMMWYVSRKMNEFREMACDDMSTQSKKTLSVEYSRALVQIAEHLVQSTVDCPSASALIRQKNELLNRVQYQMEDTMKTISRKRTALILVGLLALTAPLSWMKAKPAVEEPPSPPPVEQQSKSDWMSFPEGGFEAIQQNLVYPEAARKAGLEGKVTVEVLYTEKGFKSASIKESSFKSGKDFGCHQAALDAVQSVSWSKIKNAKEAGGHVNVPLVFALNPPPPPPITTGNIYGKITDKEGNPLFATNVMLKDTKIGAPANQSGNFYMINVPPGIYTLQASHIGFKSVLIQDVKVAVNESEEVNIQLQEAIIDMTMAAPAETQVESAPPPPPPDEEKILFVQWDSPPKPIGGFKAIQQNLVYPETAKDAGVEGRLILYVQVDEGGDVANVKVQHTFGDTDCNEAAINAVKAVKWKPAVQQDKNVKVWIAVPIDFMLTQRKIGIK